MKSANNSTASFVPGRVWGWIYGIGLMAALVVCYWPAMNGGFVWDDDAWTTKLEPLFEGTSGLWRMWTDSEALQQYYPLTGTTFWIDHQLWGQWTLPYHIENLVLHGLAVLLFWRVLTVLKVRGAWIAAGLFALHPMIVESVAWITERKNVLSQVLMLASGLSYLMFDQTRGGGGAGAWLRYGLAMLLFVAAVLAKVTVFVMPLLILVLCWRERGRICWKRDFVPLIPFFLVGACMVALVASIEKNKVGAEGEGFDFSMAERWGIAGRSFWFYPGKMLWPLQQCFIYPLWRINTDSLLHWCAPAAMLALCAGLWVWRRRAGRGAVAVVACYGVSVASVLGFVSAYGMRYSFVWDHWFYLPSLSLFAGLAGIVPRRIGVLPVLAVMAVLGAMSWTVAGQFRDRETLWLRTLERDPNCWLALNNLAVIKHEQGDVEAALSLAKKSAALNPAFVEATISTGAFLVELNRADEAEALLQTAVKRWKNVGELYYNLGHALEVNRKTEEAISAYAEAVRLSPKHALAYSNMGRLFLALNRLPEAKQSFESAITADPNALPGLNNLIWMLASSEDASIRDGKRAVALAEHANTISGGASPLVVASLAAAYAEADRYSDAKTTAARAITLAREQGKSGLAETFEKQRSQYERGQALRQTIR